MEDRVHFYHSIENYTHKTVQNFKDIVTGEWVALEKVHGANFLFFQKHDGELKCGKRTGLLGPDEKFFDYQTLLPSHKDKIAYLLKLLDCDELTVYGEICGGGYPHKDVMRNPAVKCVQKGLFYSPEIEFYAFDIRTEKGFLNYDLCLKVFEEAKLLHAKPLARGSLDELLKFEVEKFPTTIPKLLGLPKLEGNFAEGIVIKPVEPVYVRSARVIMKKKASKFIEKNLAKEQKKKERVEEALKEQDELSVLCKTIIGSIEDYLTENRLTSALSKVGTVSENEFHYFAKMVTRDVWNEMYDDFEEDFLLLGAMEKQTIKKECSTLTAAFVTKNKDKIVENKPIQ